MVKTDIREAEVGALLGRGDDGGDIRRMELATVESVELAIVESVELATVVENMGLSFIEERFI